MHTTNRPRWILRVLAIASVAALGCASSAAPPPATPSAPAQIVRHSPCNDWEIFFATDSAELSPQTRTALGELAQCLQRSQVREVTVVGGADPRGTQRWNGELAQQRADAVREVLVAHGCAPSVVSTGSAGERGASGLPLTFSVERRAVVHAHDLVAD